MEQYEYKNDIIASRTGNVGSSDAKMLDTIAQLGYVPNSALKRLAVVKGLIENDNFTNAAMRYGDFIENMVYANLKASDERWQSNPCIVSEKYSRKNCRVITHVDFMLQDDKNRTLTLCECKATKGSYAKTRNEYEAQLKHHWLLGQEYAKKLGDYKVKLLLCQYCTDNINLGEEFTFDPERLTVKPVRFSKVIYDLGKAMDIVDEFLETYDYYTEDDTIDYEYLPSNVQKEFDTVTSLLAEIKEREDAVNTFKTRLYDFLVEKNIKSIKNDAWSITRVDPTTTIQFDSKKYLDDFAQKHPIQYKKLRAQYDKKVSKKGYVSIKLSKNNND